MRAIVKIAAYCLLFAPFLIAATPKPAPTLQPLLAQLAQRPDDADVRKRIIQMVLAMPHPPPLTPEFQEQIGAAGYLFKHAATAADFQSSVLAFKKASLLAPWVPNIYYDIALADERMQNFDDAIANLNWYLTAAPRAKDAGSVYQKIGALQAEKQHNATANAQATAAAQTAVAAQVAAAQVAARRTASFNAVKQALFGANYKMFICGLRHPAAQWRICNLDQYAAETWWTLPGWDRASMTFSFGTDDTIDVLSQPNGAHWARGTVNSDGSLSWQCSGWAAVFTENTGGKPNDTVWNPAWSSHTPDWSKLTFSCDRPAFGTVSPTAGYHYWMIAKP